MCRLRKLLLILLARFNQQHAVAIFPYVETGEVKTILDMLSASFPLRVPNLCPLGIRLALTLSLQVPPSYRQ